MDLAHVSELSKADAIELARKVLRGERNLSRSQLKGLYQVLESFDQFAYATEVLLVKLKEDEDAGDLVPLASFLKLATYIYKDHSLPSSFKFDKALQELKTSDDMFNTKNCETLGIAGAIYKKRWQFDHQSKNLSLSRFYYQKGFEAWQEFLAGKTTDTKQDDDGYTAINFAYVNELMAIDKMEESGRLTGLTPGMLRQFKEAADTRNFILKRFLQEENGKMVLKQSNFQNWVFATLAEAHFGLRNYEEAEKYISQYIKLPTVKKWEIRTFSQQLFSLAYLQLYLKKFNEKNAPGLAATQSEWDMIRESVSQEGISKCLYVFTEAGGNTGVPEVKKDGKQGLALSGGGFRASLFHIGVFASLAEQDALRNIEVLSCVSGGSIIGAYYYLKLKVLLESKTEEEITRQDYIQLVKEMEKEFLSGVQKNLRVRIYTSLRANFKMLINKNYSRTHRLGELYEKHLYKQVWDNNPDSILAAEVRANGGKIYMHDLFINPKLNAGETFSFTEDNWKRKCKIPQLVLNATSVNTGHNWQFTASWMGEPPGNILADIDVKPRLRRMYYRDAPDNYKKKWYGSTGINYRKFPLGCAVGASSCVPVMFHPMPMHDLYPEIDLQLIDGGLHDNQGIAALIEEECKNMIISDASGQMATNAERTDNLATLFYRADTILQERLRELQFLDIKERNYTTQLNKLITIHLKNDLQQNPKNWKFCTDPPRTILYASNNGSNADLTTYGLLRKSQGQLAEIRTDLDAFHDTEAYALMYSGYRQLNYETCRLNNTDSAEDDGDWDFCKANPFLTEPDEAIRVEKLLNAAKKVPMKVLDVSVPVRIAAIIAGIIGIIILLSLAVKYWRSDIVNFTVAGVMTFVVFMLLGFVSKQLAMLANFRGTFKKYLFYSVAAIVASLFTTLYMIFLNPVYLNAGKLKKPLKNDLK